MPKDFDSFVLLAEMRTGSNFLETNLNAFPDIQCHGEAFNPAFIGYPNATEILGVTQAMRDADPQRLVATIAEKSDGIGGFRYFHDHDARVLDGVLDDPRCAKVILTRNPLDSYVSWKIAQATGQWKLTNVKSRKDGRARFDAAEFEAHVAALQAFQLHLLNRLQTSGQAAFHIPYEDIQDLDVVNGLARYLGSDHRLDSLNKNLKPQNPAGLDEKVSNFDEMQEALSQYDRFNLTRTPSFEPRRGPIIPGYVAAPRSGLLFMPMRGAPDEEILDWLAAVDGATRSQLLGSFNQKSLRAWMRGHPGFRSFTVLRHPLARAHHAFCRRILPGDGSFTQIRRTLGRVHGIELPDTLPDPDYDRQAHRLAFAGFLEFIKANLNGQTGVRVDGWWASQAMTLQGQADFAQPSTVIREDELQETLDHLAGKVGAPEQAGVAIDSDGPFTLAEIYDEDLEQRARDAYPRDYLVFGFEDWAP